MTKNTDFNESVNAGPYYYTESSMAERGFSIRYKDPETGNDILVGSYVVLDLKEDSEFTKRKLKSLMQVLNGKDAKSIKRDDSAICHFDRSETPNTFIIRELKEKGISRPVGQLSLTDAEMTKFSDVTLIRFCATLSTPETLVRDQKAYPPLKKRARSAGQKLTT
ncbi:MAG: hypothetical protein CMH32_05680 [Micavibrio sp.]|nr:hypothetical protein [Micavibrio sp.]HCK32303.1 hypothetical protein [Rhodospirillaceae bacterium]|tara:strand:+ start:659 stop:1153 length:495 start_codon:yes stop_codon:yes gene_type:complete